MYNNEPGEKRNSSDSLQSKLIGSRVQEVREKAKDSRKQLAELLDRTENTVCKIENGTVDLTLVNAIKIADHYCVNLDWLCGRADDIFDPENTLDTICKHLRYISRDVDLLDDAELSQTEPRARLEIHPSLHEYFCKMLRIEAVKDLDDEFSTDLAASTKQKCIQELDKYTPRIDYVQRALVDEGL